MANVIPATRDKPATIELTPEEQEKVQQATPETFLTGPGLPKGIRLKVSEEVLTEEAREAVHDGVLELDDE